MITESGRVVALNGNEIWVQTIRQSACNSCQARQGCGQRVLAGVTGGRANQVLVENTLKATVGDDVTLAIGESALLGASLLAYAVPLGMFVMGALSGHWLMPDTDIGAMVGAAAGLALGFTASRWVHRRQGPDFSPKLLKINRSGAHREVHDDLLCNPTDS